MGPDLDLSRRLWTKTRGEFTAVGTWIRIEGNFRPCMVLVRAGSELDDRLIPCVITQDKAWVWSEEIGDPEQAARTVHMFLLHMGLSSTMKRAINLASFIHDMLGDLLHIPPFVAPALGQVIGEVTMTEANTGRTIETELRDD